MGVHSQCALNLDDVERARTKLVRAANAAETLLHDALHALRNGSPHITDEFIDRAIDHLRNAH